MRWLGKLASNLAVLAAALAMVACKPEANTAAPDPTKLPIVVRASEDSNGGRPVYVIVRVVDEKGFVEDGYREMMALVVEPDASVIAQFLVFPGMVALDDIALAELPKVVGVYCLFTEPKEGAWKVMFEGAEVIDVSVNKDEITVRE
ncbi:hypothetical protein ACNOYE_02130 [Nannocystaceae bacterium ST9]